MLLPSTQNYITIPDDEEAGGVHDQITRVLAVCTWVVGVVSATVSIAAAMVVLFAEGRCPTPPSTVLTFFALALYFCSIVLLHCWIMQRTDAVRDLPMNDVVPFAARYLVYTACLFGFAVQVAWMSCDDATAVVMSAGPLVQTGNLALEAWGRRRRQLAIQHT